MAGTTRLELATSAVTEWVLQQLRRHAGTAKRSASHIRHIKLWVGLWVGNSGGELSRYYLMHWKYIIGNVIVYRDVYRESLSESWGGGRVTSKLPVTRQRIPTYSQALRDPPGTRSLPTSALWPIWLGLPQLPSGSSSWKNSRNPCSTTLFFGEASDAIFCIPMI